jgi:DNA-binding transcriptional LysR family regulator
VYLARVPLAAHGTPRHPSELAEHECLGFAYWALPTALDWQFTNAHGPEHAARVKSRFSIDNGAGLRMAALEGLGIIPQPVERVQEDLASGRQVQLLAEYESPSRPIHLLYSPDRRPTPKLRSLIDAVFVAFGK